MKTRVNDDLEICLYLDAFEAERIAAALVSARDDLADSSKPTAGVEAQLLTDLIEPLRAVQRRQVERLEEHEKMLESLLPPAPADAPALRNWIVTVRAPNGQTFNKYPQARNAREAQEIVIRGISALSQIAGVRENSDSSKGGEWS